jgi:hypothetical protein
MARSCGQLSTAKVSLGLCDEILKAKRFYSLRLNDLRANTKPDKLYQMLACRVYLRGGTWYITSHVLTR